MNDKCYGALEVRKLECLHFKSILVLEEAKYENMSSRPFDISTTDKISYPVAYISFKDRGKVQNKKEGSYASVIMGSLDSMLDNPKKRGQLFEYPCDSSKCTQ